jgi:pyruvate,water dikinase
MRAGVVPLARSSIGAGCGAKASNLARLMALGHRVPRGIVVTDREYRRHLASARIESADGDAAEIRRRIVAAPLAPRLRERLRRDTASMKWPVAVRSSASAEDSHDASFAGQLDTLLGVESLEGIEHAIRVVWASPWSERCRSYADARDVEPGAFGVIVQEQVDARMSGVLFTRDPLDARADSDAVIEFVAGLGDRLVGGEVDPGRVHVAYGSGAVTRSSGDALGDGEARALAEIGLALERALGGPQDIEWSIDRDGRIVLLQSRPITAIARRVVWSNANIAENFPDPVTPFLFSIVSRGYSAYFRNLALGFGISPRRVRAMAPCLDEIVGLQGGRLYYNLSNIHSALRLAPGGEKLAASFNRFTGAAERPATQTVPLNAFERATELVRVAAMTAWKYLGIQGRIAAFERRIDAYAERTRPELLASRSLEDLMSDLDAFLEIRLDRWNDAGLADAAAMVCYAMLERLVSAAAAPGQAHALQHDLLKGLPGLASAQPVEELWRLACDMRADAGLTADSPAFRARFDDYVERCGFRYSRELMLTSPTPREDPAPMLAILRSYLADEGPGPAAISARQARARIEATAALERRLTPHPWLRALPFSRAGRLRIVLAATQGAIRLRERARMKQARLYTRLRFVMLAIGERLVQSRILAHRDDVFFLSVNELQEGVGEDFQKIIVPDTIYFRRAELAACAGLRPPDSLSLAPGAAWRPDRQQVAAESDAGEAMRGTSACGGASEGAAHVIEDVSGIGAFRAGEILVTRQTDPGWAAVFFLTKGLVIERGGMLSHGAIIAREYGIPAVVGVNDATRRIRSGERIRVDGDNGVVELCGR